MAQIKNSFDKDTIKKIIKGGLIAFTGAGAIALLQYFGQLQINNPLLASFVAFAVPTLVNTIKEWMKGE